MKLKELKQIKLKGGDKKIMKTKVKQEKGITLIALVITIVVLLILAGVSINAIFSENGIINKAKDAQNKMNQATQNDLDAIDGLSNWIDSKTNGTTGGESTPVTNPYADQQWTMAYVCNNGTWSNTPLISANGDTIPEGTQIVAKFYATGKKTTPPNLIWLKTYTFNEGDEYNLIIEGTGEMGELMTTDSQSNPTNAYGWQYYTVAYSQGISDICIIPYVTNIVICDGITRVGNYAFLGDSSLKSITLGNTVKILGEYSINLCNNLENIIVPNSVEIIERNVFYNDINLKNIVLSNNLREIGMQAFGKNTISEITIPKNVTKIGYDAFIYCENLSKVKILITDITNFEVSNNVFNNLQLNSKIYVLSEEMKTKLEGSYDTTKSTIEVVTQEQMNQI